MTVDLVTCEYCERSWQIEDEPACDCADDSGWFVRMVEFDDD